MLASEKIAIAAHLHVLLRRITGRVTDTEWMAANAEYAAAMAHFAHTSAVEENRPELSEWAFKLEVAMGLRAPRAATQPAPAMAPAAQQAPVSRPPDPGPLSRLPDPGPASRLPGTDPGGDGPRYVGGLR
ncbi:MAG: hypothetical protein V4505_16895 [Pseudomonadota bacterium]